MKPLSREKSFIYSSILFMLICAGVIFVHFTNNIPQGTLQSSEQTNNFDSEDVSADYEPETIEYEDVIGEVEYTNMPEGKSYRSVTKRTVVDTRTGSRLVYIYPVFSGFGDEEDRSINSIIEYQTDKQRKINAQGYFNLVESGARVIYEITGFSIEYADEKLLSIRFNSFFDVLSDSTHIDTGATYFSYSVNLDLTKMDIIESEQLFSDFLLMGERLKNDKMTLVYGSDDIKNIKPADMLSQYSIKYDIYPDIYFTKDSVNIIISLTSDLGGYAVFSDNLSDSREYVNQYLLALSLLYNNSGG